MPRDWRLRLADILEAIANIEEFTSDVNESGFVNDLRTVHATLHNLEIIGEAVSKLPEGVVEAHPEVPWADIKGMRNIIAHEYFSANLPIIWETVVRRLPELREQMRNILDQEPNDET